MAIVMSVLRVTYLVSSNCFGMFHLHVTHFHHTLWTSWGFDSPRSTNWQLFRRVCTHREKTSDFYLRGSIVWPI